MPPVARRQTETPMAAEEMKAHASDAARLMKALGNEQRMLILCNLLDGPMSVGELNARVSLSQSALSQHLAVLRESGLVETRRDARSIHYSLPAGPVIRVMAVLQDIYCSPDQGPARTTVRNGRRAVCKS